MKYGAGVLIGLLWAAAAWGDGASAGPYSVEQIQAFLSQHPDAKPIPELTANTPKDIAASPRGAALLKEAAGVSREIPVGTYTEYRAFRISGERPPYEIPYHEKRGRLTLLAFAAWLNNDPDRINDVNDFIWNICDEFTWVAPAHEKANPWTIDLYAAETACDLAHILYLIGDRMSPEVRDRALRTLKVRIFDPYIEHAHDLWWNSGRNNWTGVCAGSIGEAFLLVEPDVKRQAQGLALVLEQLDRFKQIGFEPDGACLEGIGYWGYGLMHYVEFAEMLRARTGGGVDLLADPKMKLIAQYPAAVAIGKHAFAAFADSHEHDVLAGATTTRIAERTGVTALLTQAEPEGGRRFSNRLYELLWRHESPSGEPVIEDAYLPASGIAKFVGKTGDKRVVFAVKAGHNDEPHNHNDVGSFLMRVGDVTFLCDPGGGLYNRDYFSPKRYDNVFANSYGHSVPRIAGKLQSPGKQYHGTMEKTGGHTVRIDITSAYAVPELKLAARTFTLQPDGSLALDAEYAFDGAGLEVEEAFMTWLDVDVDGPVARIKSPEGTLVLRADHGTFTAERLEKACADNHVKDRMLTRIALASNPAQKLATHVTFTFEPAK